jgi:2-oxoisovalerate ferredoxin oxidoreductase gamma subunit
MIEIRFHGRGGQGSVTGAEILADAAFREGKWSQKIPVYGGERRGAPVMAFLRIDDKKVTINSPIETPDCIIVLDQMLPKIANVTRGLKEGGIAVLNDTEPPEKVDLGVKLSKIATVDATGVSNELFGPRSIPITNTTMLAAFCKATGWVKLETLFEPIKERFGGRISEANIEAAKRGYNRVKIKEL